MIKTKYNRYVCARGLYRVAYDMYKKMGIDKVSGSIHCAAMHGIIAGLESLTLARDGYVASTLDLHALAEEAGFHMGLLDNRPPMTFISRRPVSEMELMEDFNILSTIIDTMLERGCDAPANEEEYTTARDRENFHGTILADVSPADLMKYIDF